MKKGTLTPIVPGRALLAFGLAFLASAIVVISFGNSQPTLGAEGGARMSLQVYSGTSTLPGALICDVGSA